MNALRNRVQLIGNLGMDPEIRTLDSGKKYARLSLATKDSFKNAKGERISETMWHQLIAWGKTADIIEKYLKKGAEIAVDGKIVNRSYEDNTGQKRFISEVHVNEVMMMSKK